MKESTLRFYRIVLNFTTSIARSFVGILLGVFATPIILRCLGQEQYGAYRVLVDWTSHLGLLEFGLFPSLQAIFAKSLSKSSIITPITVSKEAHKKYLSVLLFQLLGLGIIIIFAKRLIPVSPELEQQVLYSLFIITISVGFVFSQIYRAYLDASQQGYLMSGLMIIQNIIFIFLSIILAILGFGIIGQAIALVISLFISFLVLFFKTHKFLFNWKNKEIKDAEFSISLKEQRTPQFIAALCGRGSLLLDNLIISALMGAKTVTAFYLTQRLITLATGQLQQIGNATWPAMTELYFTQDERRFKSRVIEVTQLIAFASGLALAPLCYLNQPFITLWTGEETFAGQLLTNIVIYNAGLIALITFWQWCFTGVGLIKRLLPCLIAQAVVNIACSFLFTKTHGIIGPALGTLISFQLITVPWQSYLMKDIFEVPLVSLTKAWMIPFCVPVLGSIALTYIIPPPHLQMWSVLMIGSAGLYLLCAVTFMFLFLPKNTRHRVIKRIHGLLQSRLGSS